MLTKTTRSAIRLLTYLGIWKDRVLVISVDGPNQEQGYVHAYRSADWAASVDSRVRGHTAAEKYVPQQPRRRPARPMRRAS